MVRSPRDELRELEREAEAIFARMAEDMQKLGHARVEDAGAYADKMARICELIRALRELRGRKN